MDKAYLILSDGTVFTGKSIGAKGDVVGEVVFTTAMVGYTETLSDPSYYGQIVTQTFPLIGNYGSISVDAECEKPALAGYIVRELCADASNYRMETSLSDYLVQHNVVGICDIDTRALTRKIRESGVMNGMIATNIDDMTEKLKTIKAFKVIDAVKNTSVVETKNCVEELSSTGEFNVVLWDFGAKLNIDRELAKRGCKVLRVPYNYTAEQILALKPDGIMLSNGGGDPQDNLGVIEQLRILNEEKIPTFGICLGHQLLALANGAKTKKLKYGHRGANQPVKDLVSGRVYITSQNHGYAVETEINTAVGAVRYINANDNTCEGIDYKNAPMFSVQFHPEACGGPRDTEFLFDRFIELMRGAK